MQINGNMEKIYHIIKKYRKNNRNGEKDHTYEKITKIIK